LAAQKGHCIDNEKRIPMHASLPRTYRESKWASIALAVVMAGIVGVETFQYDYNANFAILAFLMFTILNMAVTRIVLYDDRIESVTLLGRRSLLKAQIDRLEIREKRSQDRSSKSYFLISKNENDKPFLIPGKDGMDNIWAGWLESIPETKLNIEVESFETGLVLAIALPILSTIFLPIFYDKLRPYFLILHLISPLMVCLYLLSSDRFRNGEVVLLSKTAPASSLLDSMLGLILLVSMTGLFLWHPWNGDFVVGSDISSLSCIAIAAPLLSLAALRILRIEFVNLRRDSLTIFAGFVGVYAYVFALIGNEVLDNSVAQSTPVPITSTYVIAGKRAGTYANLANWGPETVERSFRVGSIGTGNWKAGDTICAAVHPGAFGMRWYRLSVSCP
jgi:hypothetical protein